MVEMKQMCKDLSTLEVQIVKGRQGRAKWSFGKVNRQLAASLEGYTVWGYPFLGLDSIWREEKREGEKLGHEEEEEEEEKEKLETQEMMEAQGWVIHWR